METIASFLVNHKTLRKGVYLSRVDGDITTYDLRMRLPNIEPPLSTSAIHSFEHLMATAVRNSDKSTQIVYFGPMGCRTGFYFLVRNITHEDAIALLKNALEKVAAWDLPLPGSSEIECGNYRDHDMDAAKREAHIFLDLIKDWAPKDLAYPE